MTGQDRSQYKDWSAASEKLDFAKMRYDAAMKTGNHFIMKAAESKLIEAKKTYNEIVANL
jgi:hypothetical protein